MSEDHSSELVRLRNEVEAYRQKELADLRQRVLEAEHARDHYRQEAQRNADAAREINATLTGKITELQTKLQAHESNDVRSRRPAR